VKIKKLEHTSSNLQLIAVTDTKLLWRANLYIDEESNDWNDRHPWVEGNEWNKAFDADTDIDPDYDNENYLSTLDTPDDTKNGKQCVEIAEFTYVPQIADNITSNTAKNESGAVAYNYGGQDSPFVFNEKMRQQKEILNDSFINGTRGKEENSSGWDETTAPETDWNNYLKKSDMESSTGIIQLDNDYMAPYRPGWALEEYKSGNTTNGIVEDRFIAEGAGTDCVGFVQTAADYEGNTYAWPTLKNYIWTSPDNSDYGVRRHIWADREDGKYCWLVTENTNQDEYGNIQGLELVKPGDILTLWTNADSSPSHVAMVHEIEDENNDGQIESTDITVIEATWGGGSTWAKVVNDENSLSDFINENDYNAAKWELLRLK